MNKIIHEIEESLNSGKFSNISELNDVKVQSSTIAEILASSLEPIDPLDCNSKNTNLDGLIVNAIKTTTAEWLNNNGKLILQQIIKNQLPGVLHITLNKILPKIIKDTLLEIKHNSNNDKL